MEPFWKISEVRRGPRIPGVALSEVLPEPIPQAA